MERQIRFCVTADGLRLAYSIMGQGPALVVPPPWVSHQELGWQEPEGRSFGEALAHHHTLVQYDRPGTGLSDRNRKDFSLESELQDLETVVHHLKLKRLALFAWSFGGPVAIAYAAKYPRRVSHLILYGTFARGEAITTKELRAALISLVRAHWGSVQRPLLIFSSPALVPLLLKPFPIISVSPPPQKWLRHWLRLYVQLTSHISFPLSGFRHWCSTARWIELSPSHRAEN